MCSNIRFGLSKSPGSGRPVLVLTRLSLELVLDETLRISLPANKYVKLASPANTPDLQEAHGQKIYLWNSVQLEPTNRERAKKEATVVAKIPDVQLTTFKTWDEVGQWYAQLQNGRTILTPAIQAKAAELTAGLATDAAKERAIYNYVSTRFRYISVSLGTGNILAALRRRGARESIWGLQDKHTLFASLLKAEGIEAWPALMGAGLKVDEDVPSPRSVQSRHNGFCRTQKAMSGWTPRQKSRHMGCPEESLLDQKALVIPRQGPARLMTMPAEWPFYRSEIVNAKAALKADGTLTAHFDYTSRGTDEMLMRSAFHQTSPAQWRDLVQNMIHTLGFMGEISNVDVDNPEALDKPFHFSYDYTHARYSDWENFRITPPIFPILFSAGDR